MKVRDEVSELRELDAADLQKKVRELEQELMHLRFRKASGQLEQTARIGAIRKSIARAKTIHAEKSAS